MAKVYDVVATTGTYTDKQGQKKYLSKNVGEIIETRNGLSMKMDATFNPAGCEKTEDGKIWLKLFEPRDQGQQPRQTKAAASPYAKDTGDDFDDDIPFS